MAKIICVVTSDGRFRECAYGEPGTVGPGETRVELPLGSTMPGADERYDANDPTLRRPATDVEVFLASQEITTKRVATTRDQHNALVKAIVSGLAASGVAFSDEHHRVAARILAALEQETT